MARRLLPALLTTLLLAAPAAAAPRASLPDVEDEVMCPVCGTPLNLAQSPQADRERVFIQRLIDENASKAEIKDRLREEYGPAVLALPEDSGFSLTAYLVPVAIFGGALVLLLAAIPRWRRGRRGATAAAEPATAAPLTSAERTRLDEDLARYDG